MLIGGALKGRRQSFSQWHFISTPEDRPYGVETLSSSLLSGCHRRNRSFPLNLGVKKLLLASCNESGLCATGKIGANSSERVSDIYIAEYRQCERYHDNGCWMSLTTKIARPAGLISKICWNFVVDQTRYFLQI